jgi:hypothetical protein
MLRIFWLFLSLQTLLVLAVTIQWPQEKVIWYISGLLYLLMSLVLLYLGLQIAKEKKAYYLITIAGTSFNWVLFGILGSLISFLSSVIKFSGV